MYIYRVSGLLDYDWSSVCAGSGVHLAWDTVQLAGPGDCNNHLITL